MVSGAVVSGCGSMAVDEVKQETLSLPKNALLLEHLRAGVLTGTGEPWMAACLPSMPLEARSAGSEAPPASEAPPPHRAGPWDPGWYGSLDPCPLR